MFNAIPVSEEPSPIAGNTRLTYTCTWCGLPNAVDVPTDQLALWRSGLKIQDALPNMSPADREVLMTGSHARCFREGMKDFREEDDKDQEA